MYSLLIKLTLKRSGFKEVGLFEFSDVLKIL